jgi:hypothetical protein
MRGGFQSTRHGCKENPFPCPSDASVQVLEGVRGELENRPVGLRRGAARVVMRRERVAQISTYITALYSRTQRIATSELGFRECPRWL